MRTLFYWFLVLFFVGSGVWLMINKDSNNPYEIPYLSGESFSLAGMSYGSSIGGSKIVPLENWEDILIGQWSYQFIKPYGQIIYTMEGEVEFNEDGTFFKYITWRRFDSEFSHYHNEPDIVAGGSYSGTWKMSGEIWMEEIQKCKITKTLNKVTNDLDVCGGFYKRSESKIYGQFNDEEIKSKVTHFNEDNITIESKSFATGKTSTYSFKRIGEATKISSKNKTQRQNYETSESFMYEAYIEDSDGFTYVRNKPSMQGRIIDTVFLGQKFKVLNDELKWRLIRTPKGIEGYMYYSRVRKIN